MPASRHESLDCLRSYAVLAVVGVHAAAFVLLALPGAEDSRWWAANLVGAFTHWCVPVFVMISGALLLGDAREEGLADFYRRRALRLLWPLLGWSLIYLALSIWQTPHGSLAQALPSLLRGGPYYHLWYLYMLPGLILLAPLLRSLQQKLARRGQWGLAAGLCALAALEIPLGWLRTVSVLSCLPLLGYCLLGHLLFSASRSCPPKALWLVFGLAGQGVAFGVWFLRPFLGAPTIEWMYAYPNPLLLVMGVAVFLLGLRKQAVGMGRVGRWAVALAPLSFGIYLIHPLWLLALQSIGVHGLRGHPALAIPLTTLLVFALSALSVAAMLRVPGLSRLLR